MSKPTLILTVGLPRSGKSSYAKTRGCPIVNPDSIRLALHDEAYIPQAEKMVWTIAYYMVSALFKAGHTEVIVDATNTTKARRDFWKSDEWIRKYVVFNTKKETCIARCYRENPRSDLVPIIERMAENYEPLEEYEWEDA